MIEIEPFMPALFLLIASPFLLLVPSGVRKSLMVLLPLVALILLMLSPNGNSLAVEIFDHQLVLVKIDAISRLFALMFILGALIAGIYSWSVNDGLSQISTLVYAGTAIAGVCAGDLISFFIMWELTTISSVFIILAARTTEAYEAAFRYFLMQICSGLALLGGIVFYVAENKVIGFGALNPFSLAGGLMLLAFGIKAGFPLLNFWLADAYPKASPTSTVFLSIFTTKLAVYALLRGFAGLEWLIYIGCVMAILPACFALVENNVRRILTFSLNSQLGFMVAGIGIGSQIALNGVGAAAFASIIYQTLLFMVASTVLLNKYSKNTIYLCLVGGASIAGLPFFIGFTTKSLILSAASDAGLFYVWVTLLVANVAAVIHTSIRVPYLLFFNKDIKTDQSIDSTGEHKHQLLAMGSCVGICIWLGIYPDPLYALLPFSMDYSAFDFAHIVSQLELIVFASFAGLFLVGQKKSILLDLDWLARGLPYLIYNESIDSLMRLRNIFSRTSKNLQYLLTRGLLLLFQQNGYFASPRPTGYMAFLIVVLLIAVMVSAYN